MRKQTYRCVAIALLALACAACAVKSTDFVGVHLIGDRQMVGVVGTSAVKPVEEFVRMWISSWEKGDFASCRALLSPDVQASATESRLAEIASELTQKLGSSKGMKPLGMPAANALPGMDEALFKTSAADTLKYYDYVLGRYINERERGNAVFFFGVAMADGQLRIVSLGIARGRAKPEDPEERFYWGGYQSF